MAGDNPSGDGTATSTTTTAVGPAATATTATSGLAATTSAADRTAPGTAEGGTAAPPAAEPGPAAGRWARAVPPRGPLRVYAALSFFDSLARGVMLAGGVLFFTRVAGLGAVQVGTGLSMATLIGLSAALPAGLLGDRIGHRRLLVGLGVVRGLLLGSYLLVDSFAEFLLVVCLAGLAESAVDPVRQAYLGALTTPENRVDTLAYNRVVHNVGATLGTPALGAALVVGTPFAFRLLIAGGAVCVLLVGLVALRLPETPRGRPAGTGGGAAVLRDRWYLGLALLNGLLILHGELLEIAVPLWVTQHTAAPSWTASALLLANVFLAIGFQMRAGRGVTDTGSAARAMRRGGLAVLACSLVFATTGSLPPLPAVAVLLLAVALLTAAELLQSAGAWGLSYELAVDGRLGEYQGAWSVGTQLGRSCGPFVITLALSGLGGAGWVVLGLGYAAAAVLAPPLAARAARR
ncbi:MFS transporter [Kitasatospora sp. NPDC051705]|uniref:MFS transporter n=1 Tax=Kitasatospora sp. NPDC051705 TaxID=3364057 RepID=UPI0037A3C75F